MAWSKRSLKGIGSYFGGNAAGLPGRRGMGKRRGWFEYLEARQMMSNTPPVVSPIVEGVLGNTVMSFTVGNFTGAFSDADAGNTLQVVSIDSLPAHGTLALAGEALAVNQQIATSLLANLTYTPNAGYSGSDTFNWNGSDGGLFATTDSSVNLTVSAPSVTLTGNGTLVASGGTFAGVSNFTYYGSMSTTHDTVDLGSATRTYTLTNNSNATINLTGGAGGLVQITGTNAGDFTLTTAPASSLAPGASTTFTVTFAPGGTGTRTAEITIPNSSGDLAGYDFAIGGKGVATTNDSNTHLEVGTTTAGTGNATAANGDVLSIVYTGYLTNGSIFDSTAKEGGAPLTLRLDNSTGQLFIHNDKVGPSSVDFKVIDGWETGLQGMKMGETRTLIIPASMGYGANGTTGIPGNATLIFDVTMVDFAYSPEIGVRGNGISISNGANTTNTGDGTNYGALTLGQTQLTHTFSLLDFSEQTDINGNRVTGISVSSITLTGTNSGDFVLGLGSGSTLNVTFKPTNQGLRTAVVNVFSNDPNVPDFTFTVQGTVPPVDLTATLGTVKYPPGGMVTGAGNLTLPVVVHNLGFGSVSGANTTVDITIIAQNNTNSSNTTLKSVSENLKGLSSGQTKTFNIDVVAPVGLDDGTYTLIVMVDSQRLISEGNYTNNSVSTANISIAAGFDNITGSLVSTTIPATILSNAAIGGNLVVSVKNAGNLVLPKGEQVTIAVIAHNTGTGANTTLFTSPAESVSGLGAGLSQTITVPVKGAVGLPAGSYQYEALITPVQALTEESTTDNLVTKTAANGTLLVSSVNPDLSGVLVSSTIPANTVAGAVNYSGTVVVNVVNNGTIALPKGEFVNVQIIAHPTGAGNTSGDVNLGVPTKVSVSGLAAGGVVKGTAKVAFLGNVLTAGVGYTLEALIMPVQPLTEVSTTNNLATTTAANGTLTVASANAFVDLTGTLGTSSLVSSATGVKGKMAVSVQNIGNVALPAGQTIQLQIIAHPHGEGDVLGDVILQTSPALSVKGWKAGQTASFSVTVADVNALAGGTYDIEAKIVPVVALAESDTGNNLVTENAGGQVVALVSTNP